MREMYHELYKVKKQKKLPIKWMAPEAIHEQIFTSKSDVYVLIDIYSTTYSVTPITCASNLEVMFKTRSTVLYFCTTFVSFGCFCLTFFFNQIFSNPIEIKYSGDVFKAVQSTHSTCFTSGWKVSCFVVNSSRLNFLSSHKTSAVLQYGYQMKEISQATCHTRGKKCSSRVSLTLTATRHNGHSPFCRP